MSIIQEELIENTKQQYGKLFENALDLIIIYDLNYNIIYCNKAATDSISSKKSGIIGTNLVNVFTESSFQKLHKITNRIIKSGHQKQTTEYNLKADKDRKIFVDAYGIPLKNNKQVYSILLIAKNITKSKKIETRLPEVEFFSLRTKKRTDEATKTALNWVQTFVDNIPSYICWKDNKLIYVGCNKNYCNLLEMKEDEIIGKPDNYLNWDPENLEDLLEKEKIVIRENKAFLQSRELIGIANNRKRWFNINRVPLQDLKGRVSGILITMEDVSEQVKSEQEVKISEEQLKELNIELSNILKVKSDQLVLTEEKYENLVKNIDDLIIEIDIEKKFTYVGPQIYDLLGYYPEELIGHSATNFIHPKESLFSDKDIRDALKSNKTLKVENRIKHKDGHFLMFSIRGNIVSVNGEIRIVGVLRDVTKEREVQLKLRESEERYRTLVQTEPNLILLTSEHGLIIDCNKTAINFFNVSKKEIIGKEIFQLLESPRIKQYYAQIVTKGIYNDNFEIFESEKKGKGVWLKCFLTYISIEDEPRVFLLSQDISNNKNAERLIKQEIESLRRLNTLREEFIDVASHEIKTPLTQLSSGALLAWDMFSDVYVQKKDKLDKHLGVGFKDVLETLKVGSTRLISLVNTLLNFSLLEQGKLELLRAETNISELVRECIIIYRFFLNDRDISIHNNIKKDYWLFIDNDRIFQVIENVIYNAIKNTFVGGHITIDIREITDYIILEIRDTGIGITEEEMDKLFKKWEKIKRNTEEINEDGFGFGLYISQQLMEMHNGEIWATSEGRNKGSTFHIKLAYQIKK